jgi:hypothetical protein
VNDDDLLGDFGDDFNILEFADALDANDSGKVCPLSHIILDNFQCLLLIYWKVPVSYKKTDTAKENTWSQ